MLLVVSPDSKIPPEEVQKFFDGLSQKNNLCVLTGEKTAMGSVEKAARQLFAAQKADGRIPKGHPQREDLERKQQATNKTSIPRFSAFSTRFCFRFSERASRLTCLQGAGHDARCRKPFNGEDRSRER